MVFNFFYFCLNIGIKDEDKTFNLIFCHTTLDEKLKKMDVQILNLNKKTFPTSKIASQLRCM